MDAKVLAKYIKIKATEEFKGTPKSKIHMFSYHKCYLSIQVILIGSLDISSRDVCLPSHIMQLDGSQLVVRKVPTNISEQLNSFVYVNSFMEELFSSSFLFSLLEACI